MWPNLTRSYLLSAFSKGKLVGVAFQGIPSAELDSVGFIIPVTVLRQLLKDFDASAAALNLPTSQGIWTGELLSVVLLFLLLH